MPDTPAEIVLFMQKFHHYLKILCLKVLGSDFVGVGLFCSSKRGLVLSRGRGGSPESVKAQRSLPCLDVDSFSHSILVHVESFKRDHP